jgi:phage baseplate assembly protein W
MPDLDFPYHFSGLGRTATTDRDDHIRDLIQQVLFTSPGERVMRPDFGAGLLSLVFEPNSTTLAAATQMLVQSALQLNLSHLIAVHAVEVRNDDAALRVDVTYSVLLDRTTHSASFTAPGGAP